MIKKIFLFYFFLSIFIFILIFFLANSFLGRKPEPPQYGPWIQFSTPEKEIKKVIQQIEINKSTKVPLKVEYNEENIIVKEIKFGKDVWTPFGEKIPEVVVNEIEPPKPPDYGFRIIFENGKQLVYASYRSIRPDGLYDSIPYQILQEKVLKIVDEEWEKSKLILQYKATLELVKDEPENPIFNLIIFSEKMKVGQGRSIPLTGMICYKTNPIFYLTNRICFPIVHSPLVYSPFHLLYWYLLSIVITFLLYKINLHQFLTKIFSRNKSKI